MEGIKLAGGRLGFYFTNKFLPSRHICLLTGTLGLFLMKKEITVS
jgi:hypothetical protein